MLTNTTKTSHYFSFSKINLTVNGKFKTGDEGDTIRKFLMKNHMPICFGNCRTCKVFVEDQPVLACTTPIKQGMNIFTKAKTENQEILNKMQQVKAASNFF